VFVSEGASREGATRNWGGEGVPSNPLLDHWERALVVRGIRRGISRLLPARGFFRECRNSEKGARRVGVGTCWWGARGRGLDEDKKDTSEEINLSAYPEPGATKRCLRAQAANRGFDDRETWAGRKKKIAH